MLATADLCSVAGYRSQGRPVLRDIASRIDRRVGHTLQELVELQSPAFAFHTRGVEVQRLEVRRPPARVDDQVGLEGRLRAIV